MTEKKTIQNKMSEKWEDCVNCQYNGCKVKGKVKKSDYQHFTCNADIEEFACPRIPELYPHKLYKFVNDDEIINQQVIKKDKNPDYLDIYQVELYDNIEGNIRSFCVLSDNGETIRDSISKKLKKRVYRHIKIFNIRKLDSIINGYNVIAVPRNVSKIVYPKVDIEMDHNLKKIKMKEMVITLERFPSGDLMSQKPTNIQVDENLSVYEENDTKK